MCRLGCTPVVMTRVVNWPGVARLIFRGNSDCTRSGRPRSRWSRITPSKNGPFDASNQNFATIQDLTGPNPSRVAVLTATQGLLAVTRASFAFNAQTLGILGREGYNLDVSNPQNVEGFYTVLGDLAAGVWSNTYQVFEQGTS